MKQLTLALGMMFLFASSLSANALPADRSGFDPVASFASLQKESTKVLDMIKPWNDAMKANAAMIPADIKPKFDSFNKLLDGFNSQMGKLSMDPSKLTESAFKGLSGDLSDISKQFSSLQGLTKDLSFMKGVK